LTWARLNTLPGQLIVLFILVLLLAQIINVFLIIGERRMSARSVLYEGAIERFVMGVQREEGQLGLPIRDRRRPPSPGRVHIVLSDKPDTDRLLDPTCLADYEEELKTRLSNVGIETLAVHVCQGSKLSRPLESARPPAPPPPPLGSRRGDRPPPLHRGPPLDPAGPRAPGFENFIMSVLLEDGRWVNGISGHYPLENLTPRIALATLGMIIIATVLIVFFARRITRPLTQLTKAAENLGRGGASYQLSEEGPEDVRKTVAAFNGMQERLTRMIETQRVMLRSVGHDLRTPLTSLRIRAEAVEPQSEREKIIATLDEMKAMMEEILTWAEDASGIEEPHPVDINAMLASLSDDYQDAGQDVRFTDGKQEIALCRRVSLRRALQNLIDNGLKYGDSVELSLCAHAAEVEVRIDDQGPGIPEDRLTSVLLPFVRLETSRSKETGGAGLGLSIAQSIVQAHGADLKLQNRVPRGLRASFALPRPEK
jgi:signal transduction histidine kinase